MENINGFNTRACFYCEEYHSIFSDVPLNDVVYDMNGITPRCFLHYKFECNNCRSFIHFNGISWCHECNIFTCIECGKEQVKSNNFLIYNYYFEIQCISCGIINPALDYAEYSGTHPYQIGDLWPNQPINIWVPVHTEENIESSLLSGSKRIQNLSSWQIDNFDRQSKTPKSVNKLTKNYLEVLGRDHSILLTNIFLPKMLKMTDIKSREQILTIGSEEDELSEMIINTEGLVTNIEVSFITSETFKSEKNNYTIISNPISHIEDFQKKSETMKFDKIICNLKIMTIENLSTFFKNVFNILKKDGFFIFSISHPFSGLPYGLPVSIPLDSCRNEDKFWINDYYFNEGLVEIVENDIPIHLVLYRRTLSTYLNKMTSTGFILNEISEPQAKQEHITNFPKQLFNNADRIPRIMIIKARKY